MLSTTDRYGGGTLGDARANVVADGLFHLATWLAVAVGIVVLWRTLQRGVDARWRTPVGWVLVGWGALNLVEGGVDHHLLQIHRGATRRASNHLAWDLGFLGLGVVLVAGGWWLQRRDRPGAGAR